MFTGQSSSFLSAFQLLKVVIQLLMRGAHAVLELLAKLAWVIIKFALQIMEVLEYMVDSFLGINMKLSDYKNIAENVSEGEMNFLQTLIKTFKALVGVSLVLMIIFTVIAIIRQEIANVENGFNKKSKDSNGKEITNVGNDKSYILRKLFKNILYIVLLPITMVIVIIGTNSILSAIDRALQGTVNGDTTIAAQALSAATYSGNRYRVYAETNKRMPIIIEAYDADDYKGDQSGLKLKIKTLGVQNTLKRTAENMVNGNFLSFTETLSYKNNKISNSSDFGDSYEQFVCTPEQYQVMADFVDYAQLNNLNYTVRAIDDPRVDWSYVNDAVFDRSSNTLTIQYQDASDINKNGSTTDNYTIVYGPAEEVTSPISDALKSIMAMLGAGEYSDNVYNMMERDDSGDFVNLVQWSNEKAKIKLSSSFDPSASIYTTGMKKSDQVILYEMNHFSSNNTFGDDITIDKMKEGILLDVYEIVYNVFYSNEGGYSKERTQKCVHINGSYYPVKLSTSEADLYGNPYYELNIPDDVNIFSDNFSLLKTNGSATVKFSGGFKLNDTSTWKTGDQILIYEYYRDLSYKNELRQYSISELCDGKTFTCYQIIDYTDQDNGTLSKVTENNYVSINGTFYLADALYESTNTDKFLMTTSSDGVSTVKYDFQLLIDENSDYDKYVGASELISGTNNPLSGNNVLRFSDGFDYKNISTWTYRDYFIFYCYCTNSTFGVSLDQILLSGLSVDSTTYESFKRVSELKITTQLDAQSSLDNNVLDIDSNMMFVSVDENKLYSKTAGTRTFNFSDDFDYYDVSTWTMQDFILAYFSSAQAKNSSGETQNTTIIGDYNSILQSGYNALKYTFSYDGDKTDSVYRFGKKDYDTTVYLSETNALSVNGTKVYDTFEKFLDENLMTYLTRVLGTKQTDIVATEEEINSDILRKYSKYIMDTTVLAQKLVSDNYGTLSTIIETYTYVNSGFDKTDFSKWTNMDLLLYAINGSATGSYTSRVIYHDSTEYFVIGGKAVDISSTDSPFKLSKQMKNKNTGDDITSDDFEITSNKVLTTTDDIEKIIKNSVGGTVGKPMKQKTVEKYRYTVGAQITGITYSYDAEGNLSFNSLTPALNRQLLDVLVGIFTGGAYASNTKIESFIYTDGTLDYILVGDTYIMLRSSSNDSIGERNIYYVPAIYTLTPTSTSLITTSSYFYSPSTENYTFKYIDSVIFNLTGSSVSATYSRAAINGKNYINVNGTIVSTKVGSVDLTGITLKVDSNVLKANNISLTVKGDNDSNKLDLVSYLYNNFYSKYLISNIPNYDVSNTSNNYTNVQFATNGNGTNKIADLDPISVILQGLGVGSASSTTIVGTLIPVNSKYYYSFSININSNWHSYIIDITDFFDKTCLFQDPLTCKVSKDKNAEITLALTSKSKLEMLLYAMPAIKITSTDTDSFSDLGTWGSSSVPKNTEIVSIFTSLGETELINSSASVKLANLAGKQNSYTDTYNKNNPTTWNWLHLIYLSKTGTVLNEYKYYTYELNGKQYAEIDCGSAGTFYVRCDSSFALKLTNIFTSSASISAESVKDKVLGMIYKKLQEKSSVDSTDVIKSYSYTHTHVEGSFYMIDNLISGEPNAIYKLGTVDGASGFEASENSYIYTPNDANNVSSWSILDFVNFYAKRNTDNVYTQSKVYTKDGRKYILVSKVNYVDLTTLGENLTTDKNYVKITTSTPYEIKNTGSSNLGVILGLTGQKYTNNSGGLENLETPSFVNKDKLGASGDYFSKLSNNISGYDGATLASTDYDGNKKFYENNFLTNLQNTGNVKLLSFSSKFDASDYSTWTVTDLLLYNAIFNGYFTSSSDLTTQSYKVKKDQPSVEEKKIWVLNNELGELYDYYKVTFTVNRFQDFVDKGAVPAYLYYYMDDNDGGNVEMVPVLNISNLALNPQGVYLNYNAFMALKDSRAVNLVINNQTVSSNVVDNTDPVVKANFSLNITEKAIIGTGNSTSSSTETIGISPNDKQYKKLQIMYYAKNPIYADFTFSNYYFYKLVDEKMQSYGIYDNIDQTLISQVASGSASVYGTILLDIKNNSMELKTIDNWTILDVITAYEFSRNIQNNIFKNYNSLEEVGLYVPIYTKKSNVTSENDQKVLFINGTFYNVTNLITKKSSRENDNEYILKEDSKNIVSGSGPSATNGSAITDVTSEIEKVIKHFVDNNNEIKKAYTIYYNYIKSEDTTNFPDAKKPIKSMTTDSDLTDGTLTGNYYIEEYKHKLESLCVKILELPYSDKFDQDTLDTLNEAKTFLQTETEDINHSNYITVNNFLYGFLTSEANRIVLRDIIERYISETMDATGKNYAYQNISGNIKTKLIDFLLDFDAFFTTSTATTPPTDTQINCTDLKYDSLKETAKYNELVLNIRKEIIQTKSISAYTEAQMKTLLTNVLETAFTKAYITDHNGLDIANKYETITKEELETLEITNANSLSNVPGSKTQVTLNSVVTEILKFKTSGELTDYETAKLVYREGSTKYIANDSSEEKQNTESDAIIKYDSTTTENNKYTKILENVLAEAKDILNYEILPRGTPEIDPLMSEIPEVWTRAVKRYNFVENPKTLGAFAEGENNDYTFKAITNIYEFTKNPSVANNKSKTLTAGLTAAKYDATIGSNTGTVYRNLITGNMTSVKVNFSEFANYSISPLVKKVSWPQKLMEDMQVLYPDLNWATLIATDGWLDTLGEYTSAYASGQYISNNNSANTTAAGLVLSEFFLSQASLSTESTANYSYSTLFDQDVIKALMLSLMGEENYKTLSKQAEVFVDMFNSTFATILDDVAKQNGYNIINGQVDNFEMCVYKSYLATLLLSSDIGEYLYKIANRVVAEYTIYESLACASGDYAGYYAYTNGEKDENGDEIDTFTYGSFKELVEYENLTSSQVSPTFTFNLKKGYMAYYRANVNANASDDTCIGAYKTERSGTNGFDKVYEKVSSYIMKQYEIACENKQKISDDSDIFCYLYEVYYGALVDMNIKPNSLSVPTYLKLYKNYLDGEVTRWGISRESSITGSAFSIGNYAKNKLKLVKNKMLSISYFGAIYLPDKSVVESASNAYNSLKEEEDENEQKNIFEKFKDKWKESVNNILTALDTTNNTTFKILKNSIDDGGVMKKTIGLLDVDDFTSITDMFSYSEEGDFTSWSNLNDIYEGIQLLIEEVARIKELKYEEDEDNREYTENGSVRIMQSDEVYEMILSELNNISGSLSTYVAVQKAQDNIVKAAITYAMGQYGHSYVPAGYTFNVKNKEYTLDISSSTLRIAEYVMGGDFLTKYNVGAMFVDEEFMGLVTETKEYDTKDKCVKTKLEMWPELRGFATNLASYTSKVYFQTNFRYISPNMADNVLLTDYIADSSGNVRTSEYIILSYILTSGNCELDDETLVRILFADTTASLGNLTSFSNTNIVSVAKYLEGDSTQPNLPSDVKSILVGYLNLVYAGSNSYSSVGKYSGDTPSERVHKMFVNMMSYLMISEDTDTEEEEKKYSFENISFKDLKAIFMDAVANYEQNLSETGEQNSNRYLTLFDLLCCQMNYTCSAFETYDEIKHVLSYNITKGDKDTGLSYTRQDNSHTTEKVNAAFVFDYSTRSTVLILAGLAHRPIKELVNHQYDSLYDKNGQYDEALGDTFVVCFYNEKTGLYVPYLAKGDNITLSAKPDGATYKDHIDYYNDFNYEDEDGNIVGPLKGAGIFYTKGYSIGTAISGVAGYAMPIIAKGIITVNMKPTAIRINDDEVSFYRTDIIATTAVSDEAIESTQTVSEAYTMDYTSGASSISSSYKKLPFGSKARTTMFISSTSLSSTLKSSAKYYYMQNEVCYNMSVDDYGLISVMDEFQWFYNLSGQTLSYIALFAVVLIPLLFKAAAAAMRRILDLIFMVLIGPVIISLTSFDYEDNNEAFGAVAFNRWRSGMFRCLLSVMGFIIGFRLFYILMSTTMKMTFVSDATFANIAAIGEISFIKHELIEAVVKMMFVYTCATLVDTSGNMILAIVLKKFAGDVTPSSFASGLDGKDVVGSVTEVVSTLKEAKKKMQGIYSGQALVDGMAAAKQMAISALPGGQVVAKGIERGQKIATGVKAKHMQKQLEKKGVAKDVAKNAAQQYKDGKNEQREQKKKNRMDKANRFMSTYAGGDGKTFEDAESPLSALKKSVAPIKPKKKKKKPKAEGTGKKKKKAQQGGSSRSGSGGGSGGGGSGDDSGEDSGGDSGDSGGGSGGGPGGGGRPGSGRGNSGGNDAGSDAEDKDEDEEDEDNPLKKKKSPQEMKQEEQQEKQDEQQEQEMKKQQVASAPGQEAIQAEEDDDDEKKEEKSGGGDSGGGDK